MKEIVFQNKGQLVRIQSTGHFVIVGANGSGKSHLGAMIERNNTNNVLRISAQRALSVPDSVTIRDFESTWNEVFYGDSRGRDKGSKWGYNNSEYTIRLVNDYEKVLAAVFSYQNDEEHAFFNKSREIINQQDVVRDIPERITDRILAVWNEVFPQRQIVFETATVKVSYQGCEYQAKFMSDGERVALYLIAQCLIAPNDVTIVIDEPEIHLHKTIMTRLWDTIERY